jgi:putative addiction module component (TIGR02574 family)
MAVIKTSRFQMYERRGGNVDMIQSLEHLKTSLSQLPDKQRAELAQYLLHSLDEREEGAREEWIEVAEARMADIRAGKVIGIPAEEVLKNLLGPKQ